MNDKSRLPIDSLLDLLLDAVCMVDAQGHFVFVSAAGESIFGFTPDEMVGKRMIDMVHPEDREKTLQAASRIMSGQDHPHFENRYVRKDGQVAHIMWSARWSEKEQLRVAVARDITVRKRADALQAAIYSISEAAQSIDNLDELFPHIHQNLKNLLPSPNLFVALRDLTSGALSFPYCVDALHAEAGPPTAALVAFSKEVINREQSIVISRDNATEQTPHAQLLADVGLQCLLGMPLRSQNGTIGALVLKSQVAYTEADKELLQYVCIQIATVLERKQLFARMQHMAQYDLLTDLPNRGLLQDRLKTAISRARREQRRFSLLYLDLDNFKRINDTLGHALGDRLLHAFAVRLKQSVRETDTVARLGGDEFVVVLESLLVSESNQSVIQKIRDAFNEPFTLDAHTIFARPSIGVAHYPEHGAQAHLLLNYADSAMYMAKSNRRDTGSPDSM